MRRIFSMTLACVLMAAVTGCSKSAVETAMSDEVAKMKEELAVLKAANNEATAKAAGAKVKATTDAMMKQGATVSASTATPTADDMKAAEKYTKELTELTAQITAEEERINKDPKMAAAFNSAMMGK